MLVHLHVVRSATSRALTLSRVRGGGGNEGSGLLSPWLIGTGKHLEPGIINPLYVLFNALDDDRL